ncbi:PRTRC system protein F [Ramlibacter sp. AN1133]|uniref:PRTRC system protein F n=1 Tax=Ramlibacter sp. AN1133 TaxID=3133429 RepID=UPI0030BD7A26
MSNNVAAAAPAAPLGCFSIPALHEDVPARFTQDLQRARALARFANAAERAGVALPAGDFPDIEQVLAAQWNQFLAGRYPEGVFDGLAGEPVIGVDDDSLQVVIHAQSRLNAYQLKPVVEALEAEATGLGWFVEAVLTRASCHGHQIYDMGMATYMLDVFHSSLEEFTDEGYARALLLENGDALGRTEHPLPAQTIDSLRQQYSFWPSDLLAEVGGHAHLLRNGQFTTPAPKAMTWRQARRWLRVHPQHALAGAVDAAIRLQRALRDRGREFVWNGQDDETETMGALCFLVWDAPELVFEAVQHFEQNQYSAGAVVEAFARKTVDLAEITDDALEALAASTMDYFERWALLGRLLSHFPVWEQGDES